MQTLVWASDCDDVAAVQAMLVFDDVVRIKAEQFFNTLSPEALSADRVRLHLRGTWRDGSEFQRTNTGWSYVITESMVDRYVWNPANPRYAYAGRRAIVDAENPAGGLRGSLHCAAVRSQVPDRSGWRRTFYPCSESAWKST